ncbi:MAG: cell division topological specificity factor MinE [Lachnospiraceae bacterium]|nr:cell division topological specificity factor MinE [Lachnospiraceae bacterium]
MLFLARNGLVKRKSGSVARNRLKTVLLSERLDCSTDATIMLKNDLVQAINKYLPVDKTGIQIQFQQNPPMMLARIPILQEKDSRKDYVKTV